MSTRDNHCIFKKSTPNIKEFATDKLERCFYCTAFAIIKATEKKRWKTIEHIIQLMELATKDDQIMSSVYVYNLERMISFGPLAKSE